MESNNLTKVTGPLIHGEDKQFTEVDDLSNHEGKQLYGVANLQGESV